MAFYNCYKLNNKGEVDIRDGEIFVSVSTILGTEKDFDPVRWVLREFSAAPKPQEAYDQFMSDVQNRGTLLHSFVEADLLGELTDAHYHPAILPAITSWFDFKAEHAIEVINLEKILFDKDIRIAGQRDALLKIDGQLFLVDFKTGGVQDKAFCQLAIYKYLGLKMGEDIADAKLAVLGCAEKPKWSEGGKVQIYEFDSWFKGRVTEADAFAKFECLRHVWAFQNLKVKKFQPLFKHWETFINPYVERFKKQFEIAISDNKKSNNTKKNRK